MSWKLYIRHEIQGKYMYPGRIVSKTEWNCWWYVFSVDESRSKLLFNYNLVATLRPVMRERNSVIPPQCRYAAVYFGGKGWKVVPVCYLYIQIYIPETSQKVHVLWDTSDCNVVWIWYLELGGRDSGGFACDLRTGKRTNLKFCEQKPSHTAYKAWFGATTAGGKLRNYRIYKDDEGS